MKKVIRTVSFWAGFLVLLCVVSYILRPYGNSVSRKNVCGFYAEEENTLDIAFIGSSAIFTFWEPMEFWNDAGVTSYDFGTGTMPPQMLRYCIEEVLKTQSPKLFVIDLRPFSVGEAGYYLEKEIPNMDHEVPLRNVSDNFSYSLNRFRMIEACVPKENDRLTYHFDIIKYHTEWPRLLKLDAQSFAYADNSEHDSLKGFRLVNSVKPVEVKDYSSVQEREALSERLEPVLRELLEYCQEKDLQVLFLVNAYRQSETHKKMFNYISDAVTEYGFDYLNTNDYYEEIGLDFETDYYDQSHVNIFGADKYTDFLGQWLLERYSFEDKRGQEAYESWDDDYEIWSEKASELKKKISAKIEKQKEKREAEETAGE